MLENDDQNHDEGHAVEREDEMTSEFTPHADDATSSAPQASAIQAQEALSPAPPLTEESDASGRGATVAPEATTVEVMAEATAEAASPLPCGTRVGEYVIEQHVRSAQGEQVYVATLAEDATAPASDTPPWSRYLLHGRPPGAYAGIGDVISLRLQHSRLLAPRAIVSTDQYDYLVLEALPTSQTCPRLVGDGARLSALDALRAGAGLADALGYLHRNNVAHLHVSPDTIWLQDTRAYLSGVEWATRLGQDTEDAPALFARDANFLARTLGVLALAPEDAAESQPEVYSALDAIVQSGVKGEYSATDEVATACARAVQMAMQTMPTDHEGAAQAYLRYLVGAATTVGRVRSENQDATATVVFDVRDDLQTDVPFGVFLVADGMGGEAHGEIASRIGARITAAEMLRAFALPAITLPATAEPSEAATAAFAGLAGSTLAQALLSAVTEANRQVRGLATQLGQATGTTLTAVAVSGAHAALAHVGDSRAYLLHGDTLLQLTEDHSLLARLQAMDHPLLNDPAFAVPRSILYRSLGQDDEAPPDLLELTLEAGDRLLLCSDGLWDELDDQTIGQVLAAAQEPRLCAEQLIELANAAGGHDNSTAVVVFIEARDVEAPPPPLEMEADEADEAEARTDDE